MDGFFRIAAGVPELRIGDPEWNAQEILRLYQEAESRNASVFVVPELSITGYSCGDLFEQEILLDAAMKALLKIAGKVHSTVMICGVPCRIRHALFNTAAVLQNGRIRGFAVKEYLPDSGVFYEKRQFSPAHELTETALSIMGESVQIGDDLLFDLDKAFCFGIEICEDLWAVRPPSGDMALAGAELLINLSASNAVAGKAKYRKELVKNTSSKLNAAYLYTGAGIGESTSDLVFDGQAIAAVNGEIVAESRRFQKESQIIYSDFKPLWLQHLRKKNSSFLSSRGIRAFRRIPMDNVKNIENPEFYPLNPHPFFPEGKYECGEYCRETVEILAAGLERRMEYSRSQTMVIGVSGGLDSALTLLICARCADRMKIPRKSIVGVSMPGLGSGSISQNAANSLMEIIGTTQRCIPISSEVKIHLESIGHSGLPDTTMENAQARERTKILMDTANSIHGIVIGTGDLSEIALGWCTYNGDQMSMYNVNASLPKTLVKTIVEYLADTADKKLREVLLKISGQPFSPELIPDAPSTEEQIGSYELHDFFLWYFLRYGEKPEQILHLADIAFKNRFPKEECRRTLSIFLKRFFTQQYKRNPMPDGPKASDLSLSPRGDWRMPADMEPGLWLSELKQTI